MPNPARSNTEKTARLPKIDLVSETGLQR